MTDTTPQLTRRHSRAGGNPPARSTEVKVESIDYLGAITYYNCRTGDDTEIVVARQNLSPADAGIVPGRSLRLTIAPEHVVPI